MPKIRWTKAQVAELYRDVRAFNAARTRAIKRNPENASFLPEKLNVQDLRSSIRSRQELKALTADVNQDLKYKFELIEITGGYITKKRFLQLQAEVEIANRLKQRVAKERGVNITPPKKAFRMGSEEQADLSLFRTDLENINLKDWDRFQAAVQEKLDRSYYTWEEELYKDNYIEALWDQLGASEGVLEIVEMVSKIPAATLLKAARNDTRATFGYVYPNDTEQIQHILEGLRSVWSQYV